jgi:hypothetical protein
MTKILICPKCKSNEVKLATPDGNVVVYFICEKCNFKMKMPNDEITRTAWLLQRFSNQLLSHFVIEGELTAKDILHYKNVFIAKVFYD